MKKKKPKKAETVTQLMLDIESGADTVSAMSMATGIGETALALRIDATLGERIWSGANFEDRVGYLTNQISQDVITDVERSLLAQESYEDFTERLYKKLGIDDTSDSQPSARMRDIDNQLRAEGKVAWNEAMVSANAEKDDTTLVWRSVLIPTTTKGCAWRHGRRIKEDLDGETPELHFGGYCDCFTIPNPDSKDPETARQGQEIMDEMEQERLAWGSVDADRFEESDKKPSRLFIRETCHV